MIVVLRQKFFSSESVCESITASRLSRDRSRAGSLAQSNDAQHPFLSFSLYFCIKLYGTRGDETQSTINIHQSNQHIWYSVHGMGET